MLHESAHAVVAILCKLKVSAVTIFFTTSKYAFEFVHKNFTLSIGWIPLGGFIQVIDWEMVARNKKIAILSAGIMTNFLTGIASIIISGEGFFYHFGIISIIVGLMNCIPFQGSDLYKILKL